MDARFLSNATKGRVGFQGGLLQEQEHDHRKRQHPLACKGFVVIPVTFPEALPEDSTTDSVNRSGPTRDGNRRFGLHPHLENKL